MGFYGLVLWVMIQVLLVVVVVLCEIFIFFGVLIVFIVLKE